MPRLLSAVKVLSVIILVGLVTAGAQTGFQPSDILLNPGFSQGLSCYRDGASGKTSKHGNWRFFLSTDAHSGAYSAEILCDDPNHADCDWAYISTDPVPVTPGRNYHFSLWNKCDAGGFAGLWILDQDDKQLEYQDLNCTGSWESSGTITVDTHIMHNATQMQFRVRTGTATHPAVAVKIDDLSLKYDDDSTPPYQEVDDGGNRTVTWNSSYVSVGGTPYLALGFYDVPLADYTIARNTVGANTILSTDAVTPAYKCFALEGTDFRDSAYSTGLNLVPDSMYTVRLGLDNGTSLGANGTGGEQVLAAAMFATQNHLANIAWNLADEPDLSPVSFHITGMEMSTLATLAHGSMGLHQLPLITAIQNPPMHASEYSGSTDIWETDYAYGYRWPLDYQRIRDAVSAFQPLRPMWFVFDGNPEFDQNGNIVAYHPEEIIPKAFYAVVKGVTGILYFDWQTFNTLNLPGCPVNDPCLLDRAEDVFSELGSIQDVILSGTDVTASVTPPTGVEAIGRSYGGKTYVIAVNPTTGSTGGVFTVAGIGSGHTVTVAFEGRNLLNTQPGGKFTDPQGFAINTRHVYIIN